MRSKSGIRGGSGANTVRIFSYFPFQIDFMDPKNVVKEYSNGEVTIVWKSSLCQHSANCVRGLPSVFNHKSHPWINANGAGTQEIIDQVKKCPSGALTYYLNADK